MTKFFSILAEGDVETPPIISEQEFPPIINDYLNPVIKLDADGNIISYNLAFVQQFKYKGQDFKKAFLKKIKDEPGKLEQLFQNAKAGNQQSFYTKLTCHNERICDIHVNLIPIHMEEEVNIYVIIMNITDLIEKERQLLLAKNTEQNTVLLSTNYQMISPSKSIESFKVFSLGRDLVKALENNEMVLYFQPRVDTRTGQIKSAEALIRWEHPKWGIISPNEFLYIAEELGLIFQIEDWVLQEVCHQVKRWHEGMLNPVPISINISAAHLMKTNWLPTVKQRIQTAGISPTHIEFEITESTFLNNEEAVKNTIHSLKVMGIRILMDDFGKGYSTLSYLTQFPFDVIKIDQLFIRRMMECHNDMFIVKSIIYLARGLGIGVVAEGVETTEQLKFLKEQQCHEIQGYLFSRPVPVEEFEFLLQKKVLLPSDPNWKEKQRRRKFERINFLFPLAADMTLLSVAGKTMNVGNSNVLIEDISIGGLRFLSSLKLPVRKDIILLFETEILNQVIQVKGRIVWKGEEFDDVTEYGIEFIMEDRERSMIDHILSSFTELIKNGNSFPLYKMVKEDKYQYLKANS